MVGVGVAAFLAVSAAPMLGLLTGRAMHLAYAAVMLYLPLAVVGRRMIDGRPHPGQYPADETLKHYRSWW